MKKTGSGKYLKREILIVLLLKLLILFSIKAAFFPHRLSKDIVTSGLQDRIASSTGNVSVQRRDKDRLSSHEIDLKEK